MTIKLIKKSESKAELLLDGRLDTTSAPAAQDAFLKVASQYAELSINFTDLAYVSSAGLRALLMLQKQVNKTGGSLVLTNVKPSVKEVFEITGFAGIMNIAD